VGRRSRLGEAVWMGTPPPRTSSTTVSLKHQLAAIRVARSTVRDACAALTGTACDTAVLLTSELVTNAVRHGQPPIDITIERDQRVVKVTVTDTNPARPVLSPRRLAASDHRGLQIVDALAAAWGVQDRPVGKAVWFYVTDDDSLPL
jgi:anti-sigma regulatory factor (Ser/Thr protein kinase)